MNNQNPETPNQNWRPHTYMEEQRSHNVPRPENFYGHYPPSQFINDYLHTGYVYPGVLPSYRSGQTSMPPPNSQMVNPLTMLSPQDFTKYYNKMQNYIPPDPRLCIKNYPPHPSFYEHPHPYRAPHYHGMGLQNQSSSQATNPSIFPHQPYPSNHLSKIERNNKNKSIIVIESDEENVGSSFETKKVILEKKEEKLLSKSVELEQKRHINNQKIQQQKNQTIVRVHAPAVVNIAIKQIIQPAHIEEQKQKIVFSPLSKKIPNQPIINEEEIKQIIPIQAIDELRDEILHQLETTELPDDTMKIFLTYKTLDTHSKYAQNQEISVKVFNLLKIYRAIIEFQKQRKYFIKNIVGDQILKKFNYKLKNKVQSDSLNESKQKIDQLAQQINQNYQQNPKINGKKSSINHQQNIINQHKQITNLLYPPKTKKISKKQLSDQNSEDVSYVTKIKINEKQHSQFNPNVICERRLRDRKKKKNKKQRYQKSFSQKYLKDVQKQQKQKVQSLKAQKIPLNKENGKVDVQFSQQEEGLIQKIEGWAQRTALAYAIEQKHKKVVKTSSLNQHSIKVDSTKVTKKDESLNQVKKYKERSTKASQNEFRLMLLEKIQQEKTNQENKMPNLMTFVTSNNLSEVQKEEFQRQMAHLTKQLRNNENHGRIRIGKQYYQAKMPNFIQSQTELALLMKQKRQKLMERKMSVLTF